MFAHSRLKFYDILVGSSFVISFDICGLSQFLHGNHIFFMLLVWSLGKNDINVEHKFYNIEY
jgi:hypothetical protein